MIPKMLILVGLGLLASCAATSKPPSPSTPQSTPQKSSPYRLVNTLDTFWEFWRVAEGKELSRQVELFKSIVVSKYGAVYQKHVVGRSGTEDFSLEARLREWLPELPKHVAVMRRLTREIESNLTEFDRSFREAFPDFAWRGDVYFIVSLDAFDGSVRQVDKKMSLLFGIDKVARLHGAGAALEPLFHHELFHMHHGQVNPPPKDDRTLLYPLWNEGLAVYVAQKLNPEATWAQLVLSDKMVKQGTAQLAAIAKELRPHLSGTTEETYRDFFLGAGKRTDIPNRVGYFMGYRVVQEVAKGRSLDQLVRLRGKELFRAVDGVLVKLAATGLPQQH